MRMGRRTVISGGSLLALALAAGLDLAGCSSDDDDGSDGAAAPSGPPPPPVLDEHERAVLEAATARLVPGPDDDPAEDSPGAREAMAADYIVLLLGALHYDPPRIYAGGPFSDRAGADTDDMAEFLPLSAASRQHWQSRLADLLAAYQAGLRQLDDLAGGDFAAASPEAQDAALASNPTVERLPAGSSGFTDLLLEHTIEACYSVPEYGGNPDGVLWASIGFPGDVQPRGYDDAQVTESDGSDAYEPTPVVADLLALLASTAPPPPASSPPAAGGG